MKISAKGWSSHAFGLALAILVLISAGAYWSTSDLNRDFDWEAQAYRTLQRLQELDTLEEDADDRVMEFVATQRDKDLEPLRAIEAEVPAQIREIRALVADDPDQEHRVDALEPLIARHLNFLNRVSDKHRGDKPIRGMTFADEDAALRDSIDVLVTQMEEKERSLLAQRTARTHRMSQIIRIVLFVGSLVSFLILLTVYLLLKRENRQRREAEAALAHARDAAMESARLKSEFMANMSHEIRTPMNAIIGMTSLLADTRLDARQDQFVHIVKGAGETLLGLINDILDFSKIESGQFVLESIDVDVRGTVEDVLLMLAEKAQSKGIELTSFIPNDCPDFVWGDPHRLRQILTNLIGNAVKFTEKGEVVVRAQPEREDAQQQWIRFRITDTGIGISEDVRKKLFQAFIQADGSTTRKFGGTGLGLAISKRLVELMGGEIGVDSEPGKGSEFWFVIPFKKHGGRSASTARTQGRDLAGFRILVVDDNQTNREIVQRQMESWGIHSDSVRSGAEALLLLQRHAAEQTPYDVVILDMQMPGMDGLELAQAIASEPSIAKTRLIMMTSLGNQIDPKTLHERGILRCLSKPVRQSDFYNCLWSVLGDRPSVAPAELAPIPAAVLGARRGRILLVEDNTMNQQVTLFQLEKLGCKADLVANGREAVAANSAQPYDLILMDCQMPEMDGYAATAEIRQREGAARHTPIVAMTANALEGDEKKCLDAGMDGYISKPVHLPHLEAVIERYLQTPSAPPQRSTSRDGAQAAAVLPGVDMDYLRRLTDGNDVAMRRLVDIYLREMTLELKNLEAAVHAGDAKAIQLVAHGCKGASANYGMNAITAILQEIEIQGRDKQIGESAAALRRAQEAFQHIQSYWSSYLEGTSDPNAVKDA